MSAPDYFQHPYVTLARSGFGAFRTIVKGPENSGVDLYLYSITPIDNVDSLPSPEGLWKAKSDLQALAALKNYRKRLLETQGNQVIHVRLRNDRKELWLDVLPPRSEFDATYMVHDGRMPFVYLEDYPLGRNILGMFRDKDKPAAEQMLLPEATYAESAEEVMKKLQEHYPDYKPLLLDQPMGPVYIVGPPHPLKMPSSTEQKFFQSPEYTMGSSKPKPQPPKRPVRPWSDASTPPVFSYVPERKELRPKNQLIGHASNR